MVKLHLALVRKRKFFLLSVSPKSPISLGEEARLPMGITNSKWKADQLEGKKRWPAQHVTPNYTWRYYAKVSVLFMLLGGSVETFMIMSGFYKLKMDRIEDIDKALAIHYENAVLANAIKSEAEKKLKEMGKLKNLPKEPKTQ